jgi:hypothetical protein
MREPRRQAGRDDSAVPRGTITARCFRQRGCARRIRTHRDRRDGMVCSRRVHDNVPLRGFLRLRLRSELRSTLERYWERMPQFPDPRKVLADPERQVVRDAAARFVAAFEQQHPEPSAKHVPRGTSGGLGGFGADLFRRNWPSFPRGPLFRQHSCSNRRSLVSHGDSMG